MPAATRHRSNWLTRGLFALACLGTIALLAWGEVVGWRAEMTRVEDGTSELAQYFVQHAEDTLELAKTPLVAVVAQLENLGTDGQRLDELRTLMLRLKIGTPPIRDLFIYDEAGNWLLTTAEEPPAGANNADRDYFKQHAASSSRLAVVGAPVVSRSSGEWIIPVTMRFNKADGSFGGVVLASVAVQTFGDYFENFQTGQLGSTILVRGDGVVLARAPFDPNILGRDISDHELFVRHLSQTDTGHYFYQSPIDAIQRIGGFHRSWRSQLVVLTAVSQSEATATWIQGARWRWGALAVTMLAGAVLLLQLYRQNQARRQSDLILAAREAELSLLADNANDLVERIDLNGIRRYVSPSAIHILGVPSEALVGTNAFESILPEDRQFVTAAVASLYRGERSATVAFRLVTADRSTKWVESTLSVLPATEAGEMLGVVSVTRDISERKVLEHKLQELATLDGLTGIPNRRAFDARIEQEVARCRRDRRPLSVVLIDVDHFKLFNDKYGHLAGDACLQQVAKAIDGCMRRPADFAARYGGEEFVVVLPETDTAGAHTVAEEMRRRIEELDIPHSGNPPWLKVTASLGLATQEHEWLTPDELVHLADQALYAAKAGGRNRTAREQQVPPTASSG